MTLLKKAGGSFPTAAASGLKTNRSQALGVIVSSIDEDTIPPMVGIDGRIPVIIGMAAKKSYLEHRPVKISEIENPVLEPPKI